MFLFIIFAYYNKTRSFPINYINLCVLKDISQIIVPFVTGTYDTTVVPSVY